MSAENQKKGLENDIFGLQKIWDFGWLRPQELGLLIWKESVHATKYAERIGRKWEKNGYVISRKLPDHAGTAWVLSEGGANFLRMNGILAKTGKDWGDTKKNEKEKIEWIPPTNWKHDLLANSFLARLFSKRDFIVIPEKKIKRENNLKKIPDGLCINPKTKKVYLIEAEKARKTGEYMHELAKSIVNTSSGKSPIISGFKPTSSIIIFTEENIDDRGNTINHELRIINAIEKITDIEINLLIFKCAMKGPAVIDYKFETKKIGEDYITRRLAYWNKYHPWYEENGNKCCFISGIIARYYYDSSIKVWEWELEDTRHPPRIDQKYKLMTPTRLTGLANSSLDAMRQIAANPVFDEEDDI